MSMSEFDGQLNSERDETFYFSSQVRVVPADFGEEDLAFAEELHSLFSPEEEELPPYYVQTLLASEEPDFYPVEPGFERKTSARVFRHLKLRRRLFHTPRSVLGAFVTGISGIYARRSLLASVAAFMVIMLFTVAFTAPSFAAGMAILLHGSRGGVYEVNHYPKVVRSFLPHKESHQPEQITLLAAQQQLHFKMYWPQALPRNYYLNSIYLYQETDQPWVDGPIIELVYNLYGVTPKGTGQLVIREFKPNEEVLQVVQDNAVHPIQIAQDGHPRAIYVDGQWVPRSRILYQWVYGVRSELIYQQDGVVFWIAGDQRDGINEKALWNVAQSLKATAFNRLILLKGEMSYVIQVSLGHLHDAFTTDVLAIYPDDSPDGAYFMNASSYQSEKPVHNKK